MAIDLSRITVRPFKLSDADDVLLWAGDDRVTHNTRMGTCGSKEEALAFIRDECIVHPFRRSICLDDRSIGIVWVLPWPGDDMFKADLGYAIGVNYWGKGIAAKAVKIVLSQVFQVFPYLKVAGFYCCGEQSFPKGLAKSWVPEGGSAQEILLSQGEVRRFLSF